ncbi:GIY-YIG nuclease family protein [Saccharopolyspora sp. NPDC002686]|uniref:GIY-YIG nuclease family protein n=1 Tax=Saccharopolyspora sp. NPDC002686 TaxID=3154541 RepID=UPI003330FF69
MTTTGSELSFAATTQHLELLGRKRLRLEEAQREATGQCVLAVARSYASGEIGDLELYDVYIRLREISLSGFATQWREAGLPQGNVLKLMAQRVPRDEPWSGTFPLERGMEWPPKGAFVVYVLFDAEGVVCYVGSTKQFNVRMKQHVRHGKKFVRWQAWSCTDRHAAYDMESRFLRQHRPYYNKRG